MIVTSWQKCIMITWSQLAVMMWAPCPLVMQRSCGTNFNRTWPFCQSNCTLVSPGHGNDEPYLFLPNYHHKQRSFAGLDLRAAMFSIPSCIVVAREWQTVLVDCFTICQETIATSDQNIMIKLFDHALESAEWLTRKQLILKCEYTWDDYWLQKKGHKVWKAVNKQVTRRFVLFKNILTGLGS